MLVPKTREVAMELRASVTMNRRWPFKKVKPGRGNLEDGIRCEGTEELIKWITTPVVDANQVILPSEGEEVKSDVGIAAQLSASIV